MKRILISIFICVVLVFTLIPVLTSCEDSNVAADDLGTKGSGQNVETNETVKNNESETDSKPIGSSEIIDTSEPTPDKTPENAAVTINTDLLNEYMMTYGELTEKYGKLVNYQGFDGGNHYMFEKSPVYYFFHIDNNLDNLVTDQESGLKYMPIDDDELCRGIRDITPELLFNGTFETLSIEDISNMEGINFVSTDSDGIVTPRAYASYFTYDGWNSDKVELIIYHENENMIDLTSEARIYIHPLNIDAEEAQADENTLELNSELFSDYGLTFDELVNKYGKVTHYNSPSGGTYYKFENGYGYYCCGDVNRIVDWVYDEGVVNETGSGSSSYAVVEGDTTCYSIDDIAITDLITDSFTVLTVEEFSNIPGIIYINTEESYFNPGEYYSTFNYEPFGNEKTILTIYHGKSQNEIISEAIADIFTPNPYQN